MKFKQIQDNKVMPEETLLDLLQKKLLEELSCRSKA